VRLGGRYRITFHRPEGKSPVVVVGEFSLIDAPRQLEYTWTWETASDPDWTDTTLVKVAFNPLDTGRTEIVLTHERFSDPEDLAGHTDGWTRILDNMAEAMAGK
jgi:uncharacterized protein YndB with AHSA1/START domain